MNTVLAGTTVPLVLRVVDDNTPANNPVTGLSAVVAIRRIADDKWFDFIAGEWDTVADWGSLGAEHKQDLTDKGDGSYAYMWNQAAADSSAERTYEMTYAVTAGVGYVGRQAGEEWRFAVDYTVAGDQMDLVDAPNATAVTALQAGLATATNLATLAAQFTGITSLAAWLRALARKDTADATALSELNTGGGAYDAATDSLEAIRNTEPLGTAMRGTDGAYTGTPPTVEQIRSGLSTFNPAADEVNVGSVKGVAVTSVDDFKADVSALALEATLTAMKGDGWTTETLLAIFNAVTASAGSGSLSCTGTLVDGDGNGVSDVPWKILDGAGQLKASGAGTASDGTYNCALNAGTYYVWYGPTNGYRFTVPETIVVSAGALTWEHECEAVALPTPSAPTLCTCYLDIRALVGGAAIAEGTGWLQITQQTVPGFPEASSPGQAALARLDTTYTSDASGRITVEIVRGATVSLFAGVGAGPTGANTERRRAVNVVVPDAASYDLTQATWS